MLSRAWIKERPAITEDDIENLFEAPDHDDGKEARKKQGKRTIRAYYTEYEDEIEIRAVSATTR